MPITISNVSDPPDEFGESSYEIQIGPHVIAQFNHVRADGLGDCLRKAAAAADRALDLKSRHIIECRECASEYPIWIGAVCSTCSKCDQHCSCTSMDCDCEACIRRYEIWREEQGMDEDPTAYQDWKP